MSAFRNAFILSILTLCIATNSIAQRLSDYNTPGWYAGLGTIYLNKKQKTSLWLEYQWRRDDIIGSWQQSLARTGFQYHFKTGASAMVGYSFILSYPYGDYPAGPYHTTEHRIFEQLMWNGNTGRIFLNHRIRLEQRYVSKIDQTAPTYAITDWIYLNRARYQIRAGLPINHKKLMDKTWYALVFDEILIGFGKNVKQNVFDQNRIGLLAGYQYNKVLRAEFGVFNQTLQQSSLVAGKPVFQYNNGILLNVFVTKP